MGHADSNSQPPRRCAARLRARAPAGLMMLLLAVTTGCATAPPSFDSAEYLRRQIDAGSPLAGAGVALPFELAPELQAEAGRQVKPSGDDRERAASVIDYIFHGLQLQYSLEPTRDADGTFRSHTGNCLSFVNLFVALARGIRLSPFYVEVEDYQRWNHRQGMVISQGHIVAGLYIGGDLKTYDFMPYRVKSYREFRPIDDLTAAAHFYNNLGAEALMNGDLATARGLLQTSVRIAPRFKEGYNNLGVCLARGGDLEGALGLYRKGLEIDPGNAMLLTNMTRAYQQLGRAAEAEQLLAQIDESNTGNPFFFVYQGEMALSRGETDKALDYMTKALRLESEAPEVHLGFVKVYLALGDMDKARHHLARALTLDATNQEALRFASMLGK